MTRLERALGILLQLSGGTLVTAPDLAGRFEVSVRTIYRDIELLSALGVPVHAERGVAGGFRLEEGYFLPPVALNRAEAVSLLLSLALARSLKVTPLAAELATAEQKLLAVLPARLKPLLADARRLMGFEPVAVDVFHPEEEVQPADAPPDGAAPSEAAAVDIFLRALLDGVEVALDYRSPYRRAAEDLRVVPQGVLWDRDRWYLIGAPVSLDAPPGDNPRARRSRQRFWRADRVRAIAASTFRAAPEPDFSVQRLLGRRWLKAAMAEWTRNSPVRLRLTAVQAERLRQDWFFGQALFEAEADGQVAFSYGEDDPAKVLALVRWLGPGAELLEPREWRHQMRADLERMARECMAN